MTLQIDDPDGSKLAEANRRLWMAGMISEAEYIENAVLAARVRAHGEHARREIASGIAQIRAHLNACVVHSLLARDANSIVAESSDGPIEGLDPAIAEIERLCKRGLQVLETAITPHRRHR
jgi:hypothetical protein